MNTIRVCIRFVDRLSTFLGLAVSVLCPAMVAVLAFEVFARYIFGAPTIWAYDTAIFMFGYIGLLAGAFVQKEKAHINVDLIYNQFGPRGKAVLDMIAGLLIFFFLVLIIVYTWEPMMSAFKHHETTSSEWAAPTGHHWLMIPVGAALLILQELANWIRNLYRVITNEELRT
jgi:TRAP-type mannitol/chloroaromatic compound transport system permease small subunit